MIYTSKWDISGANVHAVLGIQLKSFRKLGEHKKNVVKSQQNWVLHKMHFIRWVDAIPNASFTLVFYTSNLFFITMMWQNFTNGRDAHKLTHSTDWMRTVPNICVCVIWIWANGNRCNKPQKKMNGNETHEFLMNDSNDSFLNSSSGSIVTSDNNIGTAIDTRKKRRTRNTMMWKNYELENDSRTRYLCDWISWFIQWFHSLIYDRKSAERERKGSRKKYWWGGECTTLHRR